MFGLLGGIYRRNGLVVMLITVASVALILLLTLLLKEPLGVFSTYLGEGAFYEVIPYGLIVLPALAIDLYVFPALSVRFVRY